jgi:hypothetical protein
MRERTPTRFEVWAWSPIIVLRVALVITYLLYIYFGIISIIAGIPVFTLTALPGYATIWGALLSVAAVVSAVAAIDDRWERIERWSSLALSSLYLAYVGAVNIVAFVSGDVNRQAVGAALTIGLVLPACRFVYLAAQAGKSKSPMKEAVAE